MSITEKTITTNFQALATITEQERQQIAQWNATTMPYPQDNCVQDLVTLHAANTPDAVALVAENSVYSYATLNQHANRLANLLQSLGVRANTLVGVCLERSQALTVGFLGVLKAGGAYVPMDPEYPTERLAFMLKDTQTPILITLHTIAARLSLEGVHVICLDTDTDMLARQSDQNPPVSATVDDLAYVIYTSGSTGQPKGAQVTHRNLLNLVFWHRHAFAITAQDRATQVAGPAFDATGWEIWPYLTSGAGVYLPDNETRVTPTRLRDWLVERHITVSFLPTALAESVMALTWPTSTALRLLLTGADTLRHYPAASLPFALINNYGLTETTVVSTFGRVMPVTSIAQGELLPSIGRPIANTQLHILDEQLQPLPIGAVGELYIGGASVGKGYLNRPELQAQRFLPDPFSVGALLYKTGDLARYRPDGQIEFLGRADQQIKIRGYRIEPNEIASVINEQAAVATSVVVALEDTTGEKRLVAYIVPVPEAELTVSVLRNALLERLPDYMLPSLFVCLVSLPLTPNGKIDHKALPPPDATNTLHDVMIQEETMWTPIEEELATRLATLLTIEHVELDDNFFMLGGHSLLGTQVIMWIAETFEITLTLRSLFEAPTVRLLAAEIERHLFAKVEAMSDDEVQTLLAQSNNQ